MKFYTWINNLCMNSKFMNSNYEYNYAFKNMLENMLKREWNKTVSIMGSFFLVYIIFELKSKKSKKLKSLKTTS